jgi:dihydropyrimidinase
MNLKRLIKNGIICTEGGAFKGSIKIENEKISMIATTFDEKEESFDEVIDAEGKYVVPGGIDPHTHMELQQSPKYRSVDDFYTGGVAAACGGTTMIVDHMSFGPKGCTLMSRFDEYKGLGEKCPIDYSFHGVFQHIDKDILKELAWIVSSQGFPSFKAYTTYGFPMHDKDLLEILEVMKKEKGLLTVHAENDAIKNVLKDQYAAEGKLTPIYQAITRPNQAEAEAVDRLFNLAKVAKEAPIYIVHMSAKESLEVLREFRAHGQKNMYAETCPQYLLLTDKKFEEGGPEEGIKYILAPPFRKKADNEALWDGLAKGDIQTVATDHCPFTIEEKEENVADYRKCPGGISGVEERMPLLFSEGVQKGRISLERFVEVSATNAAKIFGMYPRKGTILPGSDADITIIDPNRSRVIEKSNLHTKAGYSAYEGIKVDCVIDTVLSRGKVVARNNEFLGERGAGELIPRKR